MMENRIMIYYVEDEEDIRDLVVYTLETVGMEAEGYSDAASFYRALKKKRPDLVLLDIMLPDEDGVTILRKLRRNPQTQDIPIIMATAKGAEYDKVQALDLGADDYVTKPYGMMELVSRIRAVLRRAAREQQAVHGTNLLSRDDILRSGPIEMNLRKHDVTVNGREVQLTLKEYELLRMLLQNPDAVLSRNLLLERIWGYEFDGETRTVDVHVRTLRQKLGDAGDKIETVRGVGYRLG